MAGSHGISRTTSVVVQVAVVAAFFLSFYSPVSAASPEQWRTRSIYQVITDRFALPEGSDLTKCDPAQQTWCGGTWSTIKDNLDYIQNAGFTAIWISPINQNYEGARTPYGDPYHGYWMADVRQLNDRFGTEDDLKALITELHKRDMYIMVDVVVNNVMALSENPSYSSYMFTDPSNYHSYCPIQWGNTTSEQDCWLGDTQVYLPDLDTSNQNVISGYQDWIKDMVSTYEIDGLRIDAAKHVDKEFWPGFCSSAGVFCIGEVFSDVEGVDIVSAYQGDDALDSVLNFPMQGALAEAFSIPGPANVSALSSTLDYSKLKFKDTAVLGNFLENQDIARWASFSVDPQSMFNALTWTFMTDGIPIVYYGQEQSFSGNTDPYNREPLWTSGYALSLGYNMTAKLNQIRNHLVNTSDWATNQATVLTESPHGIAWMKGSIIAIATTIGSPPQNGTQMTVKSPYDANTPMTDVLSCTQYLVGSNGYLNVEYTKGGHPVVLALNAAIQDSNICSESVDGSIAKLSDSQADNIAITLLIGEGRLWWMRALLAVAVASSLW